MNNPEFRQTLQNISHNFETANQAAQENIYTFTQRYIDPCLAGIKSSIDACTAPCFPHREDNLRRKRGRSRGRAESNFDFYDAWDDDEALAENSAAWGNDELDSLLAGHGPQSIQPTRQRAMSYGSRNRRKSTAIQVKTDAEPTIIPGSSYLGFLERLPWKIGSRKLRYKPSAADLQENPGGTRIREVEAEALIEEHDEDDGKWKKGHGRSRSDTNASRSTTNSLSSRGDLIMSDEEEDAVPLDDEFAVMLARRSTNQGLSEDQSSGKMRTPTKRSEGSRRSTRTTSSKSLTSPTGESQRSASQRSFAPLSPSPVRVHPETPTIMDLKLQEEELEREEELEIQQKRAAAHRLAMRRGLSSASVKALESGEAKHETASNEVDGSVEFQTNAEEDDALTPADSQSRSEADVGHSAPLDDGKDPT
ncbi:hypothetical protein LTR10_023191 [Elasticomyces elasticus]|uniref:Associated with spindles and kinetochores protein 1 n=1 Tax=Exophiala sideris TaxID=1016849 RepID=A0ABR0J2F0_9EURO|nr:hypothetical protein LTR10_023191 [Elasticomyces elasticus]KAK5024176.1 hypothetical protein LTS07_008911 [Exophiala sideris]KAK5028964.1 hypothetical protein LTR13_008833 [Exophiala sideris]KAK5054888.1 hypothetical protein LTR69_008796 [Exophiala sideris]KAK5178787.1 hypothetical protein LTR44_008614 [Eurotiomycetes sp. CCFEE 6388]